MPAVDSVVFGTSIEQQVFFTCKIVQRNSYPCIRIVTAGTCLFVLNSVRKRDRCKGSRSSAGSRRGATGFIRRTIHPGRITPRNFTPLLMSWQPEALDCVHAPFRVGRHILWIHRRVARKATERYPPASWPTMRHRSEEIRRDGGDAGRRHR